MATETVKKTKAPAKGKSAAKAQAGETEGAVNAAPTLAAKKTTKTAAKAKAIEVVATSAPSHDEIAQLAASYWAERGWQDGYAEQDWLRAERDLLGAAS
jgi:hypothetical protein